MIKSSTQFKHQTQRLQQLLPQLAVRWLSWTAKRGPGLPLPQQVARTCSGYSKAAEPLGGKHSPIHRHKHSCC